MKVYVKKETNVIDIPEENAVILADITKDGYFKYIVTYRADPRKATQNNAITVKMYVTTKPPMKSSSSILDSNNPDLLVKNLLKKSSISKDNGRSQMGNVIFVHTSDLSSKIPNDKTGLLKTSTTTKSVSDVVLSTSKSLVLKTVSELDQQNVTIPVLENNIAKSIIPQVERNSIISKAVSQEMTLRGIDPAQISGTKTKTIQSAHKVSGGIVSMPQDASKQWKLNDIQKSALMGDLVNKLNPQNHTQLKPTDLINVLVTKPLITVDITETLMIPVGLLQIDEVYLVLSLVNNKGIEVQSINITIPHTKNVATLQIPVHPPILEVLQAGLPGKNVIHVKQVDKHATGISIYKKEIKKGIPVTDASFTFVGNIDCTATDSFMRVEDITNNSNYIIYRTIPYNESGTLSAEFSSAGSTPAKFPVKSSVVKRRNFASISGEVVNGAIALEIRDIPAGAILVSLYRRDLTNHQKQRELIVKPEVISNEETSSAIFFTDNDVKNNHIYEYQVDIMYKEGDSVTASNNLIIEYNPIVSNVVNTVLSKPEVIQDGIDLDVKFSITANMTAKDVDNIKTAIDNQGQSEFFSDTIKEQRQDLQSVTAFGIVRINLTTGQLEDFGIISDTEFSDSKHGLSRGVSRLEAGYEYKYIVTTYSRSTESTLESIEKTIKTKNGQYIMKPSKWFHPITLKDGNIITNTSLIRNHAKTPFSFGAVGFISTTTVSLADVVPIIIEAKAQKFGKNKNLIQWRVQGNIKKIDHFILILEMMGMRTVVGKCHNISETNYFQFVDELTDGEQGKISYVIIPVYYDFARGTEVGTNEVLV